MDKNQVILELVKFLKDITNDVYTNYNVDMRLYQPGLEPLSIIGKSETEIVAELKMDLFAIFSRYSKIKKTNMKNVDCQKFYGLECDALIKLAERITALMPIINCSINDEEFANMSFIKESKEYVEQNINAICIDMLLNFIRESFILVTDFQNFTIATTMTDSESVSITSPQTLSQSFRIFYEGDSQCYCTIADAIRSNQEKFVP